MRTVCTYLTETLNLSLTMGALCFHRNPLSGQDEVMHLGYGLKYLQTKSPTRTIHLVCSKNKTLAEHVLVLFFLLSCN